MKFRKFYSSLVHNLLWNYFYFYFFLEFRDSWSLLSMKEWWALCCCNIPQYDLHINFNIKNFFCSRRWFDDSSGHFSAEITWKSSWKWNTGEVQKIFCDSSAMLCDVQRPMLAVLIRWKFKVSSFLFFYVCRNS